MPSLAWKSRSDPKRAESNLFVFSRTQIRELDRLAVSRFGLPSIVLMENAARNAADVALTMLEPIESPRVLIACGTGNNGGDGLAIARHLSNAGVAVDIVLLGASRSLLGDAKTNYSICRTMGLAPDSAGNPAKRILILASRSHLLIDAIFGTGLTRPVEGEARAAIGAINIARTTHGVGVLAIDIPSGLDCDRGTPMEHAVEADVTVTFAGLKRGFLRPQARPYLGEVIVADIGAPRALLDRLGARVDLRGVSGRTSRRGTRGR